MMMGKGERSYISIHAPLRERHNGYNRYCSILDISIHAPLRERLIAKLLNKALKDFNPRSLAGATRT